jgi:hypothetical protein
VLGCWYLLLLLLLLLLPDGGLHFVNLALDARGFVVVIVVLVVVVMVVVVVFFHNNVFGVAKATGRPTDGNIRGLVPAWYHRRGGRRLVH